MKIWRPFTQMATAQLPIRVSKARGPHLITDSGQKIIDGISSWWVINHGHCEPEIMKAIEDTSKKLDQIQFANFTHENAEALMESLADLTQNQFGYCFFSDNGSTSIEVALKMILQKSTKDKPLFVALENSYHGDTVGAMSLGSRGGFTKSFEKVLFDVHHLPEPKCFETWLKQSQVFLKKNQKKISGLIIEPLIQGAGGMNIWPVEQINKLCLFARQLKIPIIFDEVMTGFGRTSKLFAYEYFDFIPDYLCLSKGLTGGALPMALTLTQKETYEHFLSESKSKMFFHGHSFTGNPLSTAAALASCQLFHSRKSQYQTYWKDIELEHRKFVSKIISSPLVKNPRAFGTVLAFELESKDEGYMSQISEKIMSYFLKKAIYLRPLGNTIYLMAPFSLNKDQLSYVYEQILKGLECEFKS